LTHAKWAEVKRNQYKKRILIRKAVCPCFQDVQVDLDRVDAEYQESGPPDVLDSCCCELQDCQNLDTNLPGYVTIPHLQGEAVVDADVESNSGSEQSGAEHVSLDQQEQLISEHMIATGTETAQDALSCFSVFQKKIDLMQQTAKKIIENEKKIKLQRHDGTYVAVPDLGGRQAANIVLQDLHQATQNFTPAMQQELETASAQLDSSVTPDSEALKIATGAPLNAYHPQTWAAAFVEFFYGDGTPGLNRQTPLLFEEWASCLQEREELEYQVPSDRTIYKTRSPNRWVKPEILAMLHDGQRRLKMFAGAKACVNRAGFHLDVRNIAKATVDDFIGAVGAFDSAHDALASDAPSESARACLRALLFATASVPGTEGYRIRQRHFGLGLNLLFNPCTLFFTLNLADTRSPIVLQLDQGPEKCKAERTIDLYANTISMPSLREMHARIAQNPRSQGRFFLLKHELFLRHVLGLKMFHYGNKRFEARLHQEDYFAASLQPALVFAPAAGFGLGEAQARGFKHTHNKLHATNAADAEFFQRLLRGDDADIEANIKLWQKQCLDAAASIVYESSVEIGHQLNIEIGPEPFSEKQQAKSKMDGGCNVDGSLRKHVPLQPPMEEEHMCTETALAEAESRPPRAAFDIPLTGSSHSIMPAYSLLQAFPCAHDALPPPHAIPFDEQTQSLLTHEKKSNRKRNFGRCSEMGAGICDRCVQNARTKP